MIEATPGLCEKDKLDRVVIIPARKAIIDYARYSCYICQPRRTFKISSHLGFYYQNKIDKTIPAILGYIDEIILKNLNANSEITNTIAKEETFQRLIKLKDDLQKQRDYRLDEDQKVVILTEPNDERTTVLSDDIRNDKTSESGRIVAFTQNQRYVSLEKLKTASTTTE